MNLYPQLLVCDIPRDVVDELCGSDVNPGSVTFVTLHSNVSDTISGKCSVALRASLRLATVDQKLTCTVDTRY